jgi:cyclase
MYRPRLIPCLLIQGGDLVKTIGFSSPKYIGDPLHAVHLFNEFNADELILLDIKATKENRCIPIDFVRNVGEEANMPFSVGGGIKSLEEIRQLLEAGAERVVLGTVAAETPSFVREASERFGKSTIAVCIDIKYSFWGKQQVVARNGQKVISADVIGFAKEMERMGAGELLIQSVNKDGTYQGLEVAVLQEVTQSVGIPVVGLGGLASLEEIRTIHPRTYLNGYAAGSLFIYQGKHRGVLVNYPSSDEVKKLFN